MAVSTKGSRDQGELAALLDQGLDDPGVTVTLIDGRVGGQAVEVLATLDVPHPNAFAAVENDIQGRVVVGSEAVFEGDVFLGLGHGTLP
jgi:hypothetical protein